ncbi:hypothetical protein [Amycolatopsis pigmentata]|uniref:Lipoprotein n=1 Tax=Amycolatopsis pigmentata TaxID=450801 RepID=A0ABW5G0R1_9PSEU
MPRTWLVSIVGVVLVLAGCSSPVPGTASVNDTELKRYQAARGPLNVRDALGDLTTVDYCSVLDLARAQQAGAAEVGPPKSMWNQCAAAAKVGGRDAALIVGLLVDGSEEPRVTDLSRKLDRGLMAQMPPGATPHRCVRYLGFPDGPSLEVDVFDPAADTYDLAVLTRMCAVTSALFDGLTADALAKKVAHFTFAPGSLGTTDACSVLSDAAVSAELGKPARRQPISTGHRCVWKSGAMWVDLDFDVSGPIPPATDIIGGRPSVVAAKIPTDCGVTTTVAPSSPGSGGGVEIALLYMVDPSGIKDPCAVATALAGAAWPRLPRA